MQGSRWVHILIRVGLSLAPLLELPGLAGAQAPATIGGTVRSQSGVPVAGARLVAEPGDAATETDSDGRFRLKLPAGLARTLRVAAVGYAPEQVAVGPLAPGSRREVGITLAPLYLLDAVTVIAQPERPLLNTEDAATGGAIERAELEALPTDAREPLTLLFNVPGIAQSTGYFGDAPPLSFNGGNSLYTQYTLDGLDNNEGFLGGPRVEFPLGGLAREAALVNTYSTEYGRSSTGVVNQISRAGDDTTRGELYAYWRPGKPLDADDKIPFGGVPAAIRRTQEGFHRYQLGGGLRGAIAHARTFYALAGEYSDENEDRIGSTTLAPFLGTEQRRKLKLFGRLDHGWSPTQTTTVRFALSSVSRAGEGNGVITPEADVTTRRIGSLTAITHHTALSGGRASNTASVQIGTFRWFFPPTASDFSRPQVTVIDPSTNAVQGVAGSSNFVFDESETQVELRNVFERSLGRSHTLRAGGDLVTAWFELAAAGTNPNGAYTVYNDGNITPAPGRPLTFSDIPPDARVLSYTVDASPQQVNLSQTLVGLFLEDRWRITPSLTLQAGVRWDYDDLTSRGGGSPDLDNFQPRASFNWYRTDRSVLRGGFGWYTGKLPYAIYSDAVQLGATGNATVTFTGSDAPAYLHGPTPAELQARRDQLPPREVFRLFALGLEQPTSYQGTIGYQLQVGEDWGFSIDGVWVETRKLPRLVDLNAISRPLAAGDTLNRSCASAFTCAGDSDRPVAPAAGGFRRLSTAQSAGRARYVGLYVAVRRRLSDAWSLDANWVWSHAKTDTEDINFGAVQANCFGSDLRDAVTGAPCSSTEWADATNDRRHKVTLRSVYTLVRRARISMIGDFQTGQPVNRVAGTINPDGSSTAFDLLGSGPIRGNGFTGNLDRLPGVPRNGERLPSCFNLSTSVAYLLDTRFGQFEIRADAFNLLNGTEWGNFANGIPGGGSRTQFGRPGDPIVLRSPGPPREFQFSARYVF
jgi:hypothetical protein